MEAAMASEAPALSALNVPGNDLSEEMSIEAAFDERLTLKKEGKTTLQAGANESENQENDENQGRSQVSCTANQPDFDGHKERRTNTAVAFDIPVDSSPRRQPPKRLCSRSKKTVSVQMLQEKQQLAYERKKTLEAERMDRIHQRQEAARKLAYHVDILLRQKSLLEAHGIDNTEQLPNGKILSIAQQVSHNFYLLKRQLGKDLKIDDRKSAEDSYTIAHQRKPNPSTDHNQNTSQRGKRASVKGAESERAAKGMSFVVPLDDSAARESTKTCNIPKALASRAKPKLKTTKVTMYELDEKLRKAEERRERKLQERAKRTREGREAVMKMATKMDQLYKHEAAVCGYEGYGDHDKLAKEEAAQLALEIADQFDRLGQRYDTDLQRADKFFVVQPQGLLKK